MSTSKLRLKPEKTKSIPFDSTGQTDRSKARFPIDILGSPLHPVESVKNLGVWLDFSLSQHVQGVCKSYFLYRRTFRQVRRYLTHDATVLLANTFVSSQLDYCNSLIKSPSKFNLHTLQCIQSSVARMVTNTSRYVGAKLETLPILRLVTNLRILSWASANLNIGKISSLAPTDTPI